MSLVAMRFFYTATAHDSSFKLASIFSPGIGDFSRGTFTVGHLFVAPTYTCTYIAVSVNSIPLLPSVLFQNFISLGFIYCILSPTNSYLRISSLYSPLYVCASFLTPPSLQTCSHRQLTGSFRASFPSQLETETSPPPVLVGSALALMSAYCGQCLTRRKEPR